MGLTKFPNGVGADSDNYIDSNGLTVGGTTLTTTIAELNAMSGGGLSDTELQILDGATCTTAELNRLDDSAETETIDSGAAADETIFHTVIDNTTSGAGAITLAAPPATMQEPATLVSRNLKLIRGGRR